MFKTIIIAAAAALTLTACGSSGATVGEASVLIEQATGLDCDSPWTTTALDGEPSHFIYCYEADDEYGGEQVTAFYPTTDAQREFMDDPTVTNVGPWMLTGNPAYVAQAAEAIK